METNLLDRMLDTYLTGRIPVTMTLQNKVRISGIIKAFDSYIILMEGQKREIVYRHAISSISSAVAGEQKQKHAAADPASSPSLDSPQTAKHAPQKRGTKHVQPPSPAAKQQNLNNTLKDGLLKWMQEQKAAK